ncbi:hypothetical protein M8J76_014456 [Diaphorina citri]|nr:hypothetical protein M8J75_009880 [Diaphorina citri]KAI5737529.1 hypothetical protein M8J76_014456 [Diaphorina citri]
MSTDSPLRPFPLFSIENITTSTPLAPVQKAKKTVTIKSTTKKKTPPKVASAAKTKKKWRVAFDENQAQIDAGQKRFGTTECNDCGLLYQQNEPEDEYQHRLHHDTMEDLTHPGWKNERIVGRFGLDYVVLVRHKDSMWLHRTEKIIDLVDRDLGYAPSDNKITPNTQAYLYIRKKRIAGCLVAGPMAEGFRFLPDESTDDVGCVGEEVIPVKCGVSRIWTAKKSRNQNVAKNLLQTMRMNFIPGKVLGIDDIAFAMPLFMDGRRFLQRYCKRKDFLVYTGLAI